MEPGEPRDDVRGRRALRALPALPVVVFALGVVVVVGAAIGAPFVLRGPRWSPTAPRAGALPSSAPSPPPTTSSPQHTAHAAAAHLDLTWIAVVAVVVVGIVVAALVARWLRRQRRRARPAPIAVVRIGATGDAADPSAEVGLQHLRRGLRRALEALDEGRPPADAITRAWVGLQEAAEDAGFRRGAAETPTEFTTRILRQLDVDEGALATLRRLYLAVRFGGAAGTDDDVDAARAALGTLELQWSQAGAGRR